MFVLRVPIAEAEADAATDAVLSALWPETTAAAALEIDGAWRLEAYYAEEPDTARVAELLAAVLARPLAADDVMLEQLAPRDWVRSSLEELPPVAAGRFVVHGRHDRDRVRPHQIGIEIEAGLAFGTGHHGTTKGCLIAIDRILKQARPANMLDVGTGTGVLAIALARATRSRVLATDIDRVAVGVSCANARANQAAGFVDLALADGVSAPAVAARAPYDLVVANILANPLTAMATGMARITAPGSLLILSGLLSWQGRQVIAAYRNRGFSLRRRIAIDGWLTLILVRR